MPELLELRAVAWLLTYALHSTALLGLAWWITSRPWCRSERVRETLWKGALVGGIVSASLQTTGPVPTWASRWSVAPVEVAVVGEPAPRSHVTHVTDVSDADEPFTDRADALVYLTESAGDVEPVGDPDSLSFPAAALERAEPGAARARWTDWTRAGWVTAGALVLGLLLYSWGRLRAYLAGRRRLVDGSLPGLLAHLRRKAGILRPVRLTVCPRLQAPAAIGTLLPEICLPPRVLTDLSSELQESMLAHELAHIARFDPTWLRVCRLIETALFFQPLNRLARKRLQSASEFLCDGWAVRHTGNRIGLARCLTEVAGWMVRTERPLAMCGMTNLRSPLATRVQRILAARPADDRRPRWLVAGMLGTLTTTVALAPGFTHASASTPARPEPNAPSELLAGPGGAGSAGPAGPTVAEPAAAAPTRTPARPLRTRTRSATLTPDTSPPPLELAEGLFEDFLSELEILQDEVRDLRVQAEGRELSPALQQRIDDIERRVGEVHAREKLVRELLNRLQRPRRAVASPAKARTAED